MVDPSQGCRGGQGSSADARSEHCPHFQTQIEKLPLELTTALLPIRRCLLAERMVGLLRSAPGAAETVRSFVCDSVSKSSYCVCGPDLDTIERAKCLKVRCDESCTPAFQAIIDGLARSEPEIDSR